VDEKHWWAIRHRVYTVAAPPLPVVMIEIEREGGRGEETKKERNSRIRDVGGERRGRVWGERTNDGACVPAALRITVDADDADGQ